MSEGAEIKKLRAQRGGHKSYATKVMEEAAEIMRTNAEDKVKIVTYTQVLTERSDIIKGLNDKVLEELTDQEEIQKEIMTTADYDMRIQGTLVALADLLNNMTAKEDERYLPAQFQRGMSLHKTAKLPKIVLKSFSGDVLLFQEFWESYNSAVHANPTIDNVTKFNYLRGLLEGSAASVIAGLTLSSDNYNEAIRMLKSRYGNKQVLISAHIDKLLGLAVVHSSSDVKKLRVVYDCIEVNVRSLKGLDITSTQYGPILLSIIMSKLPEDIRLLVSRHMAAMTSTNVAEEEDVMNSCENTEWKLDDLIKFLRQEIESREMCRFVSNNTSEGRKYAGQNSMDISTTMKQSLPNNNFENRRSHGRHDFSASALYTGTENLQPFCIYCSKGHSSSKCDVITDIAARKSVLRRKGRCFLCLKSAHIIRNCQAKYRCVKCKGKHNVSICESAMTSPANVENVDKIASNLTSTKRSTTLLQSAKATVTDMEKRSKRSVRVLFDNCAQKSFITADVRTALNLPATRKERMIVNGFGRENGIIKEFDVVEARICDVSGIVSIVVEMCVVPLICSPLSDQSIELAQATYEHLISLKLADAADGEAELPIDILIGGDFYWSFATGQILKGDAGPVAVRTLLGWVLSGKMEKNRGLSTKTMLTHVMTAGMEEAEEVDKRLDILVERFWMIDSIGTTTEEDSDSLDNDVVEKFKRTIRFEGGQYTVCLPWKEEIGIMPDNFMLCRQRLLALLRRLKKNPTLLKEYDHIIKQQELDGIIESVDGVHEVGRIHYIPHREVIRDDKDTTKIRIVYDGGAKMKNAVSLNECLEKGPSMLPKIFDILVRFRCFSIAVVSDIKSAFLNIRVDEKDRNFLRFLWIANIDEDDPEIITKRHTSVLFGLNSSPFLLGMTVSMHMNKFLATDNEVVTSFLRDLYMDDDVSGGQSLEKAFDLYFRSKQLMKQGGFQLRKWATNDDRLRKKMRDTEEKVFGEKDSVNDADETKVLGVIWKPKEDMLVFSLRDVVSDALANKEDVSKRYVLKILSSIFDPLGVWAPVTILFKLLFQEICTQKVTWDVGISEEISKKWMTLLKRVEGQEAICVQRNYLNCKLADVMKIELHGFSDASGKAYACVIYLRVVFRSGEVMCRFIASKTRVNPRNSLSIPKLELMGCVILSELMKTVIASIVDYEIENVFCWSDSADCLYWVNTTSKVWERFVQNRVQKIRRNLPEGLLWNYCPGEENPADIPSRGNHLRSDELRRKWLQGPQFLLCTSECWPKLPDDVNMPKAQNVVAKEVVIVASTISGSVDDVINANNFNSFKKLVTVTCYVKRFIFNIKEAIKNKRLIGEITAKETSTVKRMWLLNEQSKLSESQLNQLSISLGAFKDTDGIVKLKGRLEYSDLDINARTPVFIPKSSDLCKLLILDTRQIASEKSR